MGEARPSGETIQIRFLLDPVCPWTFRAALWIREVRLLRPVSVEWGLLSLEYINRGQPDHPMKERFSQNRWAMRLLAKAAMEGGNEAVEGLYFELAEACHERGERLDEESTLLRAATRSGSPVEWVPQTREAPGLDGALWASYAAHCATGAFGVPTLYPEGRGIPYYGPVIDRVPTGTQAADLWDHVLGLTRHDCFFELKRPR
jgi:hypothetical protein